MTKTQRNMLVRLDFYCTAYEDMCSYNFNSFFDYTEIEHEVDLELQEKLLERINWLIDEGIIDIKRGDKNIR